MDRRSPLARVRGLGTAREGTGHWWAQRLTAIALVPLTLWFTAAVCSLAGADHAAMTDWVSNPLVSILLVLLAVAVFHHLQLGIQVVLEDYIHTEWLRVSGIMLVKGAAIALAVATILSVVRISLAH